jgi:hypothetical protein
VGDARNDRSRSPEWLFTIERNGCSRWSGMAVHDRAERAPGRGRLGFSTPLLAMCPGYQMKSGRGSWGAEAPAWRPNGAISRGAAGAALCGWPPVAAARCTCGGRSGGAMPSGAVTDSAGTHWLCCHTEPSHGSAGQETSLVSPWFASCHRRISPSLSGDAHEGRRDLS